MSIQLIHPIIEVVKLKYLNSNDGIVARLIAQINDGLVGLILRIDEQSFLFWDLDGANALPLED